MRHSKCLFATFACALAFASAMTFAVAPDPVFISPGPGINAPLDNDAEGVTYGFKSLQQGNWTFDGDSASIDNTPGAVLRLLPTLENQIGGPVSPMPTNVDWVLELFYRHTGPYGTEWPWFVKAEENAADARIVQLRYTGDGSSDSWAIHAGDAGGGWTNAVATGLSLGDTFNEFTFHYKAASQTMDAYLNGNLVAGDFTLGHGNYAVDFIQLEWMRAGVDSHQQLRLGQIPEPAFGGLAAMTAGLALRRRNRLSSR